MNEKYEESTALDIEEKLNNIKINFSPQLKKNNQNSSNSIEDVLDKI